MNIYSNCSAVKEQNMSCKEFQSMESASIVDDVSAHIALPEPCSLRWPAQHRYEDLFQQQILSFQEQREQKKLCLLLKPLQQISPWCLFAFRLRSIIGVKYQIMIKGTNTVHAEIISHYVQKYTWPHVHSQTMIEDNSLENSCDNDYRSAKHLPHRCCYIKLCNKEQKRAKQIAYRRNHQD